MTARMIQPRSIRGSYTSRRVEPLHHGGFRQLHVPTPRGFVRVWSWPERTEFELIYGGKLYVRRHARSWPDASLILRAGHFARQVERRAREGQ